MDTEHWCVIILKKNESGRKVLGVVYLNDRQECYAFMDIIREQYTQVMFDFFPVTIHATHTSAVKSFNIAQEVMSDGFIL